MRVIPTDDMAKLHKIFEPFMDGFALSATAPQEVVFAWDKYNELLRQEHENEVNSWFE